ncbi:SDR family oxidoreductase [Kitasatospora sp. NBC_01250]
MRVRGSVALVTGANRGLGRAFVRALLERGARTVYCAARDPRGVGESGGVPVRLDITVPEHVAAAAATCSDVTLLINNAGVLMSSPFLAVDRNGAAETEMGVNYFGTLSMCRAFAPVLGRNSGGALVNVLSAASWITLPSMGSYCASKAAAWALTNGARVELRAQGTLVVAVHSGFIDTEMAAAVGGFKIGPETVAARALDAVEEGREEVLADERTRRIKAALPNDLELIYPDVQERWDRRERPLSEG